MDIRWIYWSNSYLGVDLIRYAVYLVIFILIVGGAYCAGYRVGGSDTRVEYVTKEVVRYVETDKAKSAIYSSPNAGRDTLLRLYSDNKF